MNCVEFDRAKERFKCISEPLVLLPKKSLVGQSDTLSSADLLNATQLLHPQIVILNKWSGKGGSLSALLPYFGVVIQHSNLCNNSL